MTIKDKIEKLLKREDVREFYATEFKNEYDEWQLLHATRSKTKAIMDVGSSGRIVVGWPSAYVERLEKIVALVPGLVADREDLLYILEGSVADPTRTPKDLDKRSDRFEQENTRLRELVRELRDALKGSHTEHMQGYCTLCDLVTIADKLLKESEG